MVGMTDYFLKLCALDFGRPDSTIFQDAARSRLRPAALAELPDPRAALLFLGVLPCWV
jgi:hypothetical protein